MFHMNKNPGSHTGGRSRYGWPQGVALYVRIDDLLKMFGHNRC